ncbi:sigma-54 interaction domain-containing protein [Alkaliphilus peptidifermentans]|uniref:Arginine utilization regulatory protein n=1 Tax=Alkaliphilus peptidifermentans DSM 18978 TaxID=1120976 RepID=A0A1G5E377_9FIRM|nr:sigma 54-interacting transcriptional regulator [Alkaliphilus peptidifermentans]SCY21444.1 arginine utilization regulatory protein [Alkaliphilus peptidifermentans DSM 18978]
MDYKKILKIITDNIDDGIFVVNKGGEVVFYNESADNQAGVNFENAIGKNILEIFPKLTKESSTLLRVMEMKEPIIGHIQSYYNYNLKKVTIISTTYPVFENGDIIGAIEISKDLNKYGEFNDKIDKIRNSKGKKIIKEETPHDLDAIIGESQSITRLKDKIKKIAASSSPVIVSGETGTGKEMVVQSIHNLSERSKAPFVAQNCAAIPVTLLESILFGTSVGSFTDSKDSPGIFELADKGTLFLDEINSMDTFLQAKLLRVIQDGHIRRIGDKYTRRVDVRVIAAMNVRPLEAVKTGKLREDLFYRLNVLNIEIEPLRDRGEDIIVLTDYFIKKFNRKFQKNIKGISEKALEALLNHDWPGNVRELEHAIEHGMLMAEGTIIGSEDLPAMVNTVVFKSYADNFLDDCKPEMDKPLKEMVSAFEKQVIQKALAEKSYSITDTAKLLGIPRQTLHYKINNLNIEISKDLKLRE